MEESERIIDIDPKTGETKPVRVKTTKKKLAPDTMAGMYWLNNRSKGKWTQRQEVQLSGSLQTTNVANLSEDELRNLAKLGEEAYGP